MPRSIQVGLLAILFAALLHLFGLAEKQVTFERPGGSGSLIDGQSARVVWEILNRGPKVARG